MYGYNSARRDDLEGLGYSIMYIIDENDVPWRHLQNKLDIRQQKIEFLELPFDKVPIKFRGIREYIRKCYQMDYLEEPKYDLLHQMIGQMFDPVKDELY